MRAPPLSSAASAFPLALALALPLAFAPIAAADAIPPDYRPPPPPRCATGAYPQPVLGRGHGGWGGCAASTCADDVDCGARAPCREVALCVGPEIPTGAPVAPGAEPGTYRVASMTCDAQSECPTGYECQTAMRCTGGVAPPPAAPPPAATPPATSGAPRDSTSWCTIGRVDRSAPPLALAIGVIALALARRRRIRGQDPMP